MPISASYSIPDLATQFVNTTNRHIFLTGKAGTGKTTFLRKIVEESVKSCVVAAPTGIAAINANGVTLHSLLHLPFGSFIPDDSANWGGSSFNTPRSVLANLRFNATKRKLIREIELLIIDEVSMLRADLLDCMDVVLRSVRGKKHQPFGGVQMLFIGDLFQLPPVVKDEEWNVLSQYYKSTYFFEAQVLREEHPLVMELDKIFRQEDPVFIDLLNKLRHNQLAEDEVLALNRYHQEYYDEEGAIFITTHNRKADQVNQARLAAIDNSVHVHKAEIEGDFPENMYPVPLELVLKKDAQVMFIKNDTSGEGRYFNGKMGTVSELSDSGITVATDEGQLTVERYTWENSRYRLSDTDELETEVVGTFRQYPLRLAWAVTVHKSQGLTFERAILDLSGSFAPGQIYVALSRLTSLDGLILASPVPDTIPGTDPVMLDYVQTWEDPNQLIGRLSASQAQYAREVALEAFDFAAMVGSLRFHLKSFDKDEKKSVKQTYREWTIEFLKQVSELAVVGEKFIRQLHQIDATDLLEERVKKAEAYFVPRVDTLIETVNAHRLALSSQSKVKKYLREVEQIQRAALRQKFLIVRSAVLLPIIQKGNAPTRDQIKELNALRHLPAIEKEKKIPTTEISYGMYQEGMSVEEIAARRNLVEGTIMGHLASYVEQGKIPGTDFVDQEKLDNICLVIQTLQKEDDKPGIGAIKSKLGDEYTYADVKVAMAHFQYLEPEEEKPA